MNLQDALNKCDDYDEVEGYWDISLANQTWSRLTSLLTKEERELEWNGCHDGQHYNATELQLIAMRLEGRDRECWAADLISMARDHGGVVVH
jgi:hypothetical protein